MSVNEPSGDDASEREWAVSHFRAYLLYRMNETEEERLHAALPQIPGLAYDLEDAEEDLINRSLDGKLAPEDQKDFERVYVNGPEENRIRLKLQRALRLPETQLPAAAKPAAPVVPIRRAIPMPWAAVAVAASILMGTLARLTSQKSGANKQPVWRENAVS
jgi:hypothetical protein